jgi:F-type H+-transporting ATPase subunit b
MEAGHDIVGIIAKLFNFAILAGTLVCFLKSPIAGYLRNRGTEIRGGLVKAAGLRTAAAASLAAIDRKMAALPAELDALRKAGADEVAAEEARIRQAADAERTRLLDQARHEIDWQLKIARRDLTARTADLAVAVAAKRVKATITAEDQARLVDRYLGQLSRAPEAGKQVSA